MLVKSKDKIDYFYLKINCLAGLKDNVFNLPLLKCVGVGTLAAHFFPKGT